MERRGAARRRARRSAVVFSLHVVFRGVNVAGDKPSVTERVKARAFATSPLLSQQGVPGLVLHRDRWPRGLALCD
eukprot:363014-Chlamydomonas_euryale.AAC.3